MEDKNKLKIRFINLRISKPINDLIKKKLEKDLMNDYGIHSLICNVSKQSAKGGEKYSILLEVHMKNSGFALRESGNDLYKITELVSDKLHQKIHKLMDKSSDIIVDTKIETLADQLTRKELEEINKLRAIDDTGKLPILEKKQYSDNSPIHIEEAIQLMEMAEKPCFLFRNAAENGKYTVIYRLTDGRNGYGLIEPKSA